MLPSYPHPFLPFTCQLVLFFFFFQAEDGIRDLLVTGVQTCALPISEGASHGGSEKPGKLEVGGASRDSTGFGALEEGLISSRGRNHRVPLISDSDRRVRADWGQESQASSWVEAWNSACLSRCPWGERPLVELSLEPGGFFRTMHGRVTAPSCVEGLPEISELEVVRHFTRMSLWNHGIDTGFYPLG